MIGNPNPGPESSRSWQAGADFAPLGRVRLGVNVFRNDVDNLIEAVSLGFLRSPAQRAALLAREGIDPAFAPQLGRLLFHYRNVREVVTQGLELDGQADLGRGLQLAGAYTFLDAVDGESGDALAGRHRHQGAARVTWVSPARLATGAASSAEPAQTAPRPGILLLAHGGNEAWNGNVLELARQVDARYPVEVAFGMATRASIQAAASKLEARGARRDRDHRRTSLHLLAQLDCAFDRVPARPAQGCPSRARPLREDVARPGAGRKRPRGPWHGARARTQRRG